MYKHTLEKNEEKFIKILFFVYMMRIILIIFFFIIKIENNQVQCKKKNVYNYGQYCFRL